MVFPAPPDRIGVPQPERRRIGSCSQIHVKVRLKAAPFMNKTDRSGKVAVKTATWKNSVDVPGAINFELIDAVLDEITAHLPKLGIIFRARQCEPSLIGFETVPSPIGALFSREQCGMVLEPCGKFLA